MNKKIVGYILIVVIVLGGVFFITNKNRKVPVKVSLTTASVGDIQSYLSTTATVKSKVSKDYYGIQAKIKRIYVGVGDKVIKGQELVSYDISDLSAAVKQAQLQYDNAVLQKRDLKNQNNSIKTKLRDLNSQISALQASGDMTAKAQIETLKQQKSSIAPISNEKLKLADNSINMAKLSLDSAKQRYSNNNGAILADFNGVVTIINGNEGTMSSGVQPVIEVQDIENLKAVVSLGKYDANNINLGQKVIIRSGNNTYSGKVSLIGAVATKTMSATGGDAFLSAEINILDIAPRLKIDFDVDVDILIGQVKNVVKVPAEALKTEKGNKNLVYVLEGTVVHERAVEVGLHSDTEVEIKAGVKSGEKVILNPSNSIVEGAYAKGE